MAAPAAPAATPTPAPASVETEPEYKAPNDFDVMHELLTKDITSAGELMDRFGDKLKVTGYDPENRMISYVDDEGIEYETAIEQLDLTNNQEAIAKQRPKMPQTIAAVEKISAALHANTSQESVAAAIATDPNKAPEIGMDIDSIPNPAAKKKRKTAAKGGASPVVQQIEAKNAALKQASEAPMGQLELQLSVGGAPPVKVPRVRRSVKQQTKTSLAEQLDLFPPEADIEEQSNHAGSSDKFEDAAEADAEAVVTSIPIPVAAAAQAIVAGKNPKEVVAKKPTKAKKPAAPVGVEVPETFDEETFVDDELTGQEISTLQRLIGFGFPVRLQAKELYGYPKRASYDKGYLSGKSDLINKKIAQIYKPIELSVQKNWTPVSGSKTTVFNPKSNTVSRAQPKGYINENGVGVFDNNPLTMKALLENNHPVIIPEDFDLSTINPSFRYSKLGNEHTLTDIVKVNPETGSGFVSALTRQDTVLSEEPNYDFIQKVSDFENLFNNKIAGEQVIPDPENANVKVTLNEVFTRVTNIRNKSVGIGSAGKLSQPAAKAIIDNAIKPKVGNLTDDFAETASIAFDLAYRRALRLHSMRLSFDKFSERVSGEAFPSLKPDKVNAAIDQFVGLTRPEGANQKVSVAKRLQQTYGSDINPESNPDLVIANFIEDHILTAPEVAPTFRSVGAKVGNMYAEQQRSRNLFARRAIFQTTSPEDVAKLQADEAYDPMSEVSDDHIAPDKDLFSPTSQLTKGLMERTAADAVDSIDSDPELRTALNKLLRSTLYKGNSAFDVSGLTAQDAFSQLAQWMSAGNYATNPEAIGFQRGLENGDYENGMALRDALKLMHIASKSVTGSIDQDPEYIKELARNLSSGSGVKVTERQAKEFAKSIGNVATRLWSRSYVRGEQIEFARNLNEADVARLGLKNGDPQSVINALRIIASTEADPNKKLLARLLLENQSFIRQVTFSIDEVSLPYAGQYTLMADGTSAVSLNLDGYNGRGLSDALLHEYLHAFVNKVISAPVELQTEDQRAAIQRLNGILNLVRDSAASNGIDSPMLTDGLVDLNEFVTHFFTSTDFQNLVKTLSPPAKQRGFFARVIDALLDVFGLGKSTQSVYQQAFTDVVDLTRSAIHSAPLTSRSLINKLAVKSSEILGIAKRVGSSFGSVAGDGTISVDEESAAAEAKAAAVKAADEAEVSDLMDQADPKTLPFDPTTDTNRSMVASMKRSMLLIRKLVPKEIKLQWDSTVPMAEVDLQTGELFVNPQSIAALINGKTPSQASLAIKTMIDEEMRHVASFNSLTESEVATIVDSKKDSDFEEIANAYYGNEANRAAALERLRSEDPNVSGAEKLRLTEERLRMLSQKVTRGTTTEEDYAFWRTNPSTLKILGRYFKNMINSMFGGTTNINNNVASFVRGKTFLAMSTDERVAVARIVTEMRALQAGYRLAPNAMRFNPENPSDVVGMFENQLGTSFGDVEAELTRSSFPMSALNLLHGAAMSPTKATNKVVANQLAEMAAEYWGGLVTSKNITPEQKAILTQNCTEEVIAALNASGKNAADWYSTAIEVAMGVASVLHPELSNVDAARAVPAFAASEDPVQAARFAMRMALAITSQNINVEQNTRYAEEQFTLLKLNGKFDNTRSYGSKADAIKSNLNLANLLVAKYGYAKSEDFVKKEFTIKDLSTIASDIRGKKVSVTGAKKDKVNGAAIFGPKIGQGFLQNLMSNFTPVTVDLWMRRTWGRWTGDVVGDGVTEERLTNLILGAKAAKVALPDELKKIRFVPALNSKGKLIEKDGVVKMTVHHTAAAKLENDFKFRELCNETATKLDAEWQRQFKLLSLPLNKKLYDAMLSGELSIGKYIASTDAFIEKINADYKILSTSKSLPSISREVWIGNKTKSINADARKNKLSEAERNARLNELPIKFDKLAESNKLPQIPIADWRLLKFAKAGRDIVLTNKEVSAIKPAWANAANVIKSKLNPIDAPSDQDRRVITEIVNNSRLQLKALGYTTTNADIQAILWYPEKDLWALLTGKPESNLKSSYDEEFITIAKQRGLGDDALSIAESIRTDRAARNSGGDDGRAVGTAAGQTNVSVGTSFGDTLETNFKTLPNGNEKENTATSVYERSIRNEPDVGRKFLEGIGRTASDHPMGAAVEVKDASFYNDSGTRLFLAPDDLTGVAVTSYGDLVSVFKHPSSKEKILPILKEAANYATTLDAYDVNGFLPNLYSKIGFRPVARIAFNSDYAPPNWPYDLAGKPDVVLMVKDPTGKSGLPEIGTEGYDAIRDQVPLYATYDEAMAAQQAAVKSIPPASNKQSMPNAGTLQTSFGDVSRQSDAEYLKAVDAGDTAKMQQMVDAAAKAAGYTIKGWHGTAYKFTIPRGHRGVAMHVALRPEMAKDFAEAQAKNVRHIVDREGDQLDSESTEPIILGVFGSNNLFDPRVQDHRSALRKLMYIDDAELQAADYDVFENSSAQDLIRQLGFDGYYESERGDGNITSFAIFDPNKVKSADPITRDENGNVIPLSQRFNQKSNSILQTSFGDVSQLPARFDADKMDFSNFLQALEMPMLEVGTYRSPKNVLDRLFKGELDPRITTLKNHRDFFKSAATSLVQNYKTKLDSIIKKDFGSLENAPLDDIAAAIGSTHGTVLNQDVVDQIEDTYQAALETISIDDTLNAKQKTAARRTALDAKMQSIDVERTAQADAIRSLRDTALENLANKSPELARHIVQLRTLTDEVSKRVTSLYGFKPELQATFDSQLGIYLTRSYKMFHEVGFADIVRSDPSYEPQRQAAMTFFENQFMEHETARRMAAGETQSDAENNARIDLANKASNGRSVAENALEEFISQYEKKGLSGSAGSTMSESFRILQKNIKQKKDIPVELRNILGEYGPESGADNLLRSFVTVSSMAANQSFLQHVKTIGVEGGWLLTRKELDDKMVSDYDTYKNYGMIRSNKEASAYDPLGDLFGPPELVDGLNKVFSSEARKQNMDTAQDLVAKTTNLFAKLTGGAMAAKTLGSVGFYIRNVVSNMAFFGPSQGFFNIGSMAESARNEIWSSLTDPNRIEAYRTELISLGVIGNETQSTVMADLLRGTTTIQSIESQLDKLIKIGHAGTKPLTWMTDKAQQLASAADAFYKIAYYENELKVLNSARGAGGGKFATMSDYDLKREAARKVLMTAQSASQAPPIVKEITKSGIGLLFSPFLRFKAEVPRIVLNTYKLAFDEMKSGNSVIAARGQKRFAGMTFVIGGVSMVVPAVIRALVGIGDDEDEALRASLPSYLRNHTFFYRRDDNGQLQSWDFTFLNPYSLVSDPTMRSMEHLLRGDPAKAAAKFVETAIFDQYLDDQIFSSAIQSLRDNRDPSTDKPIYEPKIDSAGAVVLKSMSHVFRQAYMPSAANRIIKAYQAVGSDYTDFDNSPAGILMQEFYPVKRHDIELDKQLRRYLSETRDVYNRINERKNVLFSKKPIDEAAVRDIIKSEVYDKAAMNEDIYRKMRGYEGLGLKPQDIYSIMTSKNMGYGKDRSRLLFNKLMDRPVLSPDFQSRLADPTNEQGMDRLLIADDELKKYSRYIMIEP